ncbi:putative exported protein [Plasmodium gaboni]|uniref:Putative exported protein n=1 Tax=Plasmodium gaboni TaxID=647221 RepID=A0A151LWR4_9APIC|nr:putative exported protein [Plasmodium gaboni]KYO03631.1 putative exported protein [Plasmodium gaboni]
MFIYYFKIFSFIILFYIYLLANNNDLRKNDCNYYSINFSLNIKCNRLLFQLEKEKSIYDDIDEVALFSGVDDERYKKNKKVKNRTTKEKQMKIQLERELMKEGKHQSCLSCGGSYTLKRCMKRTFKPLIKFIGKCISLIISSAGLLVHALLSGIWALLKWIYRFQIVQVVKTYICRLIKY